MLSLYRGVSPQDAEELDAGADGGCSSEDLRDRRARGLAIGLGASLLIPLPHGK